MALIDRGDHAACYDNLNDYCDPGLNEGRIELFRENRNPAAETTNLIGPTECSRDYATSRPPSRLKMDVACFAHLVSSELWRKLTYPTNLFYWILFCDILHRHANHAVLPR